MPGSPKIPDFWGCPPPGEFYAKFKTPQTPPQHCSYYRPLQADRGGEEDHVAIPTVTYTSILMYHLRAEKALYCYDLNLIASMG